MLKVRGHASGLGRGVLSCRRGSRRVEHRVGSRSVSGGSGGGRVTHVHQGGQRVVTAPCPGVHSPHRHRERVSPHADAVGVDGSCSGGSSCGCGVLLFDVRRRGGCCGSVGVKEAGAAVDDAVSTVMVAVVAAAADTYVVTVR